MVVVVVVLLFVGGGGGGGVAVGDVWKKKKRRGKKFWTWGERAPFVLELRETPRLLPLHPTFAILLLSMTARHLLASTLW